MRAFPLLALALASFAPALPSFAEPKQDHIVVLISVDGLAHYYFDDPKAEMPTIRQLAKEGARAQRMRASMPTVTWPNHTTLVTGVQPGKHGVIGNNYFDREQGKAVPLIPDPLFDKEEIVKAPTIYDAAKGAGLKTAAIIWPASRGAKTLDWTVPDVFSDALFQKYASPGLLEEWKAAGIPYEKQEEFCRTGNGKERDQMYSRMLRHVIRTHRPNIALLHLVELDHVEHAKGPQSPEAYATVKFEDDRVKEVWEELQQSFPGKTTLIVAADHGFFPYQQQIQPNVLLKQEGLLTAAGPKIMGGAVRALGQGGASFIYILDDARRAELLPKLKEAFQKVEGMDMVLTPDEYARYGLANPAENRQAPDLVLGAKSGYSFSDLIANDAVVTPRSPDTKGAHGYDPLLPGMHAAFVMWGAGVKPGTVLPLINNTSVAPTMAALLGIPMAADGPVLKEALQQP